MAITPNRSKVLFLPVIRGFYDRSMTKRVKAAIGQAAADLGVDAIMPADDAYTDGLICADRDVRSYWGTWRADLPDVKALIAFSSDFMQERAVMDTTRLLPEDVPAFLIVNNDDPAAQVKGEPVGDTLCGSLSVHHDFRMLDRRLVASCRIDMNDAALMKAKLGECLSIIDGIEALRHMRIGLVGVNPSAFATTFTNQLELFRLGFSLHTYELLDMWGDVVLGGQLEGDADAYDGSFGNVKLLRPIRKNDSRIAAVRKQIEAPGLTISIDASQLDLIIRSFLWIQDTFEQDFIDAGAIHCWGEFGRYFGIQSCSAMMLANLLLGKPVVCEVDACHAIMAKLANVMSGEPGVILDINNNGWDPRVFNVFHCSQTPPNWLIDRGEIAGKGIVQGLMQAVPFTAISAATSHDAFHATVFTGQFLSQDPGLRGSSGWAFVPNCQDVLKSVEETGIHHFVAMKGHRGAQVAAALRFKGLVVEDMSCEMPALEEIETELPSLGASACGRCGVYSE